MEPYQNRDKKKSDGRHSLHPNQHRFRGGQATILRGQLTLLRKRCEIGIAVDTASIARAENLARELEGAI